MKTIIDQVTGNLTIEENATYHNVFVETVAVAKNIVARFYGVINENIILEEGSTVFLHGKLHGKVINRGGILYAFNASGAVETHNKVDVQEKLS